MRRTRGFTLVELLVVMAIISLLMSMLLPATAGARRLARSATCSSNLRQIGMLMENYRLDNGDYYPTQLTAGAWQPFPAQPADGLSLFSSPAWAAAGGNGNGNGNSGNGGNSGNSGNSGSGGVSSGTSGTTGAATTTTTTSAATTPSSAGFLHYCSEPSILNCPDRGATESVSYGRNGRIRAPAYALIRSRAELPLIFDGTAAVGNSYGDMSPRHIGFANILYAGGHVTGKPFDPVARYSAPSLPGHPKGDDFLLSVRVQGKSWQSLTVNVVEGGATVTSKPLARDPKGSNPRL